MLDIINPWGALRRANEEIAELEDIIIDLCDDLYNAEALIAQGHFRNPKTGCIGPKGKTYK
jgi:hypothetical protein